jgi:hypothetical protein
MFNCSNCKRKLEEGTNFCPKCGFKQEVQDKCPICLENKELQTLICGHNICGFCINKSFRSKKECPICRFEIDKCPECYQFRVVKLPNSTKKCIDCKTIIKKNEYINLNSKITCTDCNSRRVLFNPTENNYSCTDCFCKFSSDLSNVITIIPNTKICMVCFSNEIEFFDYPLVDSRFENYIDKNRCKNCEKTNVEIKTISLEEYSKIRVKSKKEVNPNIVKICPECESKDIYSIDITINKKYNCNNCKKSFFNPVIIEC